MSKRKAKPASPPTEWSLPQVMAAAQILYASEEKIRNLLGLGERRDEQSIKLKWDEAWRWRLLARLAYQFLDNLSHACEAIARDERNPASAWARFEEQGAAFFGRGGTIARSCAIRSGAEIHHPPKGHRGRSKKV